jgi:hypothetical protein
MLINLTLSCLATAAIACAQYAPPPESYTVIQRNAMFGPPSILQVYRDGSKVAVALTHPPATPGEKQPQMRTVYDLQTHTDVIWDAADPNAECSNGTFSGDWGDPFKGAAELMADLNKQNPTAAGAETVNGVPAKVSEFPMEGSTAKAKVWVDSKYGLVMRLQLPQPNGAPTIALETTEVTFAKPAASHFVPACKAAAPMPTDADTIQALTGGPASDFAYANKGTATGGGCLVLFRVVRAGSMSPVTSGYEVFVEGKPVPVQNGLARIINAPQQFNVDLRVPNEGATAPIFRQCAAPQTTLLLVVKNWDKLGEGADWLWVKSGKFAGH